MNVTLPALITAHIIVLTLLEVTSVHVLMVTSCRLTNLLVKRKVSGCTVVKKLVKPFSRVYVRDNIRITCMMTKNWHTYYAYLNTYIDEMAGSQKHSISDFVWSCGPPLVDQSNLRLYVCTMFWPSTISLCLL